MSDANAQWTVLLCYRYIEVGDPAELASELDALCKQLQLTGRVLVAAEGVNINVAALDAQNIDNFCAALDVHSLLGGGNIDYKLDVSSIQPFPDLVIKVQGEICSSAGRMPLELLTERNLGGHHLSPEEWHETISSSRSGQLAKPLVLIDVRNRKEVEFGHFEGAVDSDTKAFSRWADDFAQPNAESLRGKKVLMYCTGGVRCEKASAYLRSLGVDDVSQLSGGIHRYIERYGSNGFFKGSNFVFDSRGLQRPAGAAVVASCSGCGKPEESLSSDRVCAVCRDTVLICDACRTAKLGVYFCRDHAKLEGAYFPFITGFGLGELRRQRDALAAMCTAGGMYGPRAPGARTRRRAINKQIKRLDERIGVLSKSQAEVTRDAVPKCRSCGRPCVALGELAGVPLTAGCSGLCHGDCWGFFQKKRREEGYVDLFRPEVN